MYTVLSNILLILWRVKFGSFVKSFGVLDIEKRICASNSIRIGNRVMLGVAAGNPATVIRELS